MTTKKIDVFVDGASRGNPGPGSAAYCVRLNGHPWRSRGFYLGKTTNNRAEYTALLKAIDGVLAMPERPSGVVVTFHSDSELMVRQIGGQYRVKDADLRELFSAARLGLHRLGEWKLVHVPREKNREADRVANLVLDLEEDVDERHNTGKQ